MPTHQNRCMGHPALAWCQLEMMIMGAARMGVRSRFARCPHIRIDVWGTRHPAVMSGSSGMVDRLRMMIMGGAWVECGLASLDAHTSESMYGAPGSGMVSA